jgi:hypothetical protein
MCAQLRLIKQCSAENVGFQFLSLRPVLRRKFSGVTRARKPQGLWGAAEEPQDWADPAVSVAGDIWCPTQHRAACGDCPEALTTQKLLEAIPSLGAIAESW